MSGPGRIFTSSPTFAFPGATLASNAPAVFSNNLRLGVTLTDFTIVFCATEDTPAGPLIQDKVSVHLAPGMLKQLLANIQMAVSAYEEAIGIIPMPARLDEYLALMHLRLVGNLKDRAAGPSDAEMAGIKTTS